MKPKYSPMIMQYLSIKEDYQDTLILFRLGDFYELFFDDAIVASKELQLTLTGKNAGVEERVPMCGVPYHAIQSYIKKLISKGYKVGIVEQTEDPSKAKGIVKRDVVQIITPGAFMDLSDDDNNYIVAIDETDFNYVLSYADLSTGEVGVLNVEKNITSLINEIDGLSTREIVLKSDFDKKVMLQILEKRSILISREDDDSIAIEDEYVLSGVNDLFQMRCIARLINYLKRTQKRDIDYLQEAKVIRSNKILVIDSSSRYNLELTRTIRSEDKYGSLFWLLDSTKTAMGRRLLKTWITKPSSDLEEILRRQNIVTTFIVNFLSREDIKSLLDEVYDLERLIARICYGNANARDLLQLKNSLVVVPSLKEKLLSLNNGYIDEIVSQMDSLESVTNIIEHAIDEDAPITIKEGHIFKRGYNEELDEIIELTSGGKNWISELEAKERERTGIKTLKVGYNRNFGYYIEVSKGALDQVKDEYGYIRRQTTINGERFITPELKEKETFILSGDEKRMQLEYDLFVNLRDSIKTKTSIIQKLANQISLIDVLISLATISSTPGYVCPKFNDNRVIDIKDGKHPVIDKVMKNSSFVSNDILMDEKTDILLITGPNMGGKSTYMRQLSIIVILAQIGCYVPATYCELPIFDRIFTRIGASDDLVSGQSTFMVEMSETNNALMHATSKSLLIFDEIGRGTATYDGMALAQAIVEYIATRIGAKTMFSTHYHELTNLEKEISTLKNVQVCVSEKDGNITFLYKVIPGAMNKSYGINVAKLAHLPSDLLERANEILKSLNTNEVVISKTVITPKETNDEEWIQEMKDINPLSMSPLEALNFLYEIKKKIK